MVRGDTGMMRGDEGMVRGDARVVVEYHTQLGQARTGRGEV